MPELDEGETMERAKERSESLYAPRVWQIRHGDRVYGGTGHVRGPGTDARGPENAWLRVVEAAPVAELLERVMGLFPEVAGDHSVNSGYEDSIIAAEAEIEALLQTLRAEDSP